MNHAPMPLKVQGQITPPVEDGIFSQSVETIVTGGQQIASGLVVNNGMQLMTLSSQQIQLLY
jgi:hypothetical protein